MDKIILEVKGLEKSFGEIKAVKGVSFSVKKGEKFVFVGPNGAGKSTTINIISTLLRPDSGEVFYDNLQLGKDDDQIRQRIGVVFQDHVLDDDLTVRENLLIRGSLYDKTPKEVEQQADLVEKQLEMDSFINQRYG